MGKPLTLYSSVSIKYGWQNMGNTNWQKSYRGPYYGVGIDLAKFDGTKELGIPISTYGFFGIPIVRFGKFEFYNELQLGFAWNNVHYHPTKNPSNIAIGSGLTLYLNVGIVGTYRITKRFDLGAGISFTHYSNGGFERPNRGLNLYSPHLELKYRIGSRPDINYLEMPDKNLPKSNDLYFMLGYGNHQIVEHEFDTNYYSVMGLGITYSLQHGNVFRSGLGVDFNYLRSLSAKPNGSPGVQGTLDNLTIGLLYAPELLIGDLSIVAGIGVYAKHHKYGNFTQLYQRAGVKYHFGDFSAGMNVRSINFMLAEFLEFNIGYRVRWFR